MVGIVVVVSWSFLCVFCVLLFGFEFLFVSVFIVAALDVCILLRHTAPNLVKLSGGAGVQIYIQVHQSPYFEWTVAVVVLVGNRRGIWKLVSETHLKIFSNIR